MHSKVLMTAAIGAALTLATAPAVAQHHAIAIGHPDAKPPVSGYYPGTGHNHRGDHGDGHGLDGSSEIWGGYELASSYDDRDWAPESGNDWWNSRPDRAYPRWVQEQRARGGGMCSPDRMWWSGTGWHC